MTEIYLKSSRMKPQRSPVLAIIAFPFYSIVLGGVGFGAAWLAIGI